MARVVIIGAGIVGLSVARAALQRGHQVHLLEQSEVPNPHSASYDQHRMIRYHYGAAVGYTRMVTPAFEAWSRVWDDIGSEQFEDTGAIAISLEAGDYAAQTLAAFRELGVPHEVLDRAGVERLCPHLQLPDGAWGVVAFPGGPLFAGRIVTELARWVAEHGAVVEGGCRIARVDQERGVAIRADGSTVEGDILVVAAGAWLPALMPERYGDASTWRQGLCYVEPPAHFAQPWRDAPAIVTLGDHAGYTLPDRRGAGLKFGHGPHRRRARPEIDGFGSDLAAEGEAILAPFRPYLRDAAEYRPTRIQVGYYVLDASRRFRLDTAGRGLVVTHCDGQMFKFGPLLGERIIAMFDGAESASDLARWAAGY